MGQNSKYKGVKIILIFNLQVINLSYSVLTILYIHLKILKTQLIDNSKRIKLNKKITSYLYLNFIIIFGNFIVIWEIFGTRKSSNINFFLIKKSHRLQKFYYQGKKKVY